MQYPRRGGGVRRARAERRRYGSTTVIPVVPVTELPCAPTVIPPPSETAPPREIGGPKGPEPTRYGDWEVNGRCSDF